MYEQECSYLFKGWSLSQQDRLEKNQLNYIMIMASRDTLRNVQHEEEQRRKKNSSGYYEPAPYKGNLSIFQRMMYFVVTMIVLYFLFIA